MGTVGQSITLANSIIGVGILAMPFCFQQCGVLLATLILLLMGLVSRLCCHFLLKSALLSRRRTFEFLAFHVFGPAGKLAVEVGIIGFLMGTCIAYFVVVGDLGPQIIAKMFNINQSDILRTSIMVIVSLVCVLPLGLLRNVDSLNNVSAATIGFYFCLVIKLITEATSQLLNGDWQAKVEMWKPTGVLQCVPIFSMALFCQTQLFEIFESLPTLSLEKMNLVTKNAINICTAVYFTLGLFGYIGFCTQNISGNILMSLAPTMANDVIRLGFVMSLAFSFPLIIFPCRASLYSFLYKKAHPPHHDHIINHSIPESTFRTITVGIIGVALCISLLIPNIELVLGLVGSTIGVLVCVVFPAACFVNVTFKNTNERVLAKGVVILGLVIMVLGTYANLQAAEGQVDRHDDKITQDKIDKIVEAFFENMDKRDDLKPMTKNKPKPREEEVKENEKNSAVQPPNPVPPESAQVKQENKLDEDNKNDEKLIQIENEVLDKVSESHPKNLQTKLNEAKNNEEKIKAKIQEKAQQNKPEPQPTPDKTQEKIDMIKQQQLIETIKQHGEEQKELIKEQKEILDEIIKTKKEIQQNKKEVHEGEARKIAVESIQKIANMAIKSLSVVSEKPREKESDQVMPIEKIANEAVQEIAKQAVEAIKEIKDNPQTDKENVNAAGNPINNPNALPVSNVPSVQNSEAAHNVPQSSLNNVAPVNPVISNVKQDNDAPIVDQPNALPLIQNENIVPQNNNLQMNSNNMALDSQPIVSQLANKAQAAQNLQNIGQPENVQEMPRENNQINQQEQINNVNQIVEKPNFDTKINDKTPDTQVKSQNDEPPLQNNQINNNIGIPKSHSHSPDEPQSYKQGEDTQKVQEAMKSMAQNVPIPIAMNGNAQNQPKVAEVENVIQSNNPKIDVQNDFSNVQTNGAESSPLSNIEEVPVRQKREVVDCTQSLNLSPQDREICKSLVGPKIEIVESKTEEILPAKVDLGEIALQKNLPIHHIRTLKSFDEVERNR